MRITWKKFWHHAKTVFLNFIKLLHNASPEFFKANFRPQKREFMITFSFLFPLSDTSKDTHQLLSHLISDVAQQILIKDFHKFSLQEGESLLIKFNWCFSLKTLLEGHSILTSAKMVLEWVSEKLFFKFSHTFLSNLWISQKWVLFLLGVKDAECLQI